MVCATARRLQAKTVHVKPKRKGRPKTCMFRSCTRPQTFCRVLLLPYNGEQGRERSSPGEPWPYVQEPHVSHEKRVGRGTASRRRRPPIYPSIDLLVVVSINLFIALIDVFIDLRMLFFDIFLDAMVDIFIVLYFDLFCWSVYLSLYNCVCTFICYFGIL